MHACVQEFDNRQRAEALMMTATISEGHGGGSNGGVEGRGGKRGHDGLLASSDDAY